MIYRIDPVRSVNVIGSCSTHIGTLDCTLRASRTVADDVQALYLMKTDFSSVQRRRLSVPASRPCPLDLYPPKGSSGAVDGEVALTPTVPASSALATRIAFKVDFVSLVYSN